jgi:hypothetical protein
MNFIAQTVVFFQQKMLRTFFCRVKDWMYLCSVIKSREGEFKYIEMNTLPWIPSPWRGAKRESRENRELSRNCDLSQTPAMSN